MFHMVSYQLKPDRVAENEQHTAPLYFIELGWRGDRVAQIRDFRYVPCIVQEGSYVLGGVPCPRPPRQPAAQRRVEHLNTRGARRPDQES